jgi:hypothetical protein
MHRVIKARNAFMTALLAIAVVFTFSGNAFAQQNAGHLTPAEALEYMKKTPNVFIVDISPPEKFETIHFIGSVNIPLNELLSRMNEIPEGRPVLIHCRLGRTCVKAYPLVRQVRPDIREIFYIGGKPLFTEYNNWVKSKE